MTQTPNPTYIFHITAIDNLASIAEAGALSCKTELLQQKQAHASIAYEHIQDRRAQRAVSVQPGGVLHNYVPFHFAPRSPMLFTINQGNVPDCTYRQADIVHLCSDAQTVAGQKLPFAFSDYHAVLDYAKFYNDLKDLGRIDWSIFFEQPLRGGYCPYWKNDSTPRHMLRKETRQAEFLVHKSVPLTVFNGIAAANADAAAKVSKILEQAGLNIPVKSVPAWYY